MHSVSHTMIPVLKYSIYVQDWNAGTWSRFFSSTDFGTAVDMLMYLDRRMPEALKLKREMIRISGQYLLN